MSGGETKWVYAFSEGSRDMRDLLGGKGANVADMTRLGLPVPPGFTITTAACIAYLTEGRVFPEGLEAQTDEYLAALEADAGKRLGDPDDPLLVSVRSGGRDSMPGMMDTILNLGLNDQSVEGLAAVTGNARFAFDSYRRFIQMYGDVVCEVDKHHFESALTALKTARGAASDVDLAADDLRDLTATFKAIFQEHYGEAFPQDARAQLDGAVRAVFASWENRRAYDYRRLHGIPHDLGTAVNVQRMVFGNTGERSGTGVAFTRDNATGESGRPFGDFLMNAQGEDVVAGIRTPRPLEELAGVLPDTFAELMDTMGLLERTYRDMQDVEFTIEDGRLYMLQTRNGKRGALARVRIAVDMVDEGLVTEEEALRDLIDPASVPQLLLPQLDRVGAKMAGLDALAIGVNASPGAATGKIVLTADEAERQGEAGEAVILVRDETTPDDLHGMIAAKGIMTARGGKTSHAAVVAVGMGRPAVCGVDALHIDGSTVTIGAATLTAGDIITIDGTSGQVFAGAAPVTSPDPFNPYLVRVLEWADRARVLAVRTNADTPEDARRAREFGAEGIGLCRTEHMFFASERVPLVQAMILSDDDAQRARLLALLRPFQVDDFTGIFREMRGLPVTIRLLDPPLHEFLPGLLELTLQKAENDRSGVWNPELDAQLSRVVALHEENPMLGTRGVRLGLEFPEIIRMQAGAIMEAAVAVRDETGDPPLVEIMIPLVAFAQELRRAREIVIAEVEQVLAMSEGAPIEYRVGTMIELPRAALTSGEIATEAEFFSFGTNDLTQTTLGFSRDDAEKGFLGTYLRQNLLASNPFETLDIDGVGRLIRIAAEGARPMRPDIKLGICGEHGGDPASIGFCHDVGLHYVSCSPFRVQVARIAAGQAALRGPHGGSAAA
jgi:pyruvate,orthophosphate dikinase